LRDVIYELPLNKFTITWDLIIIHSFQASILCAPITTLFHSHIHSYLFHLYHFSITFSVQWQWRYHHKLSHLSLSFFCYGIKIPFKLKFSLSSRPIFIFILLIFFETLYLNTINCMSVIYPGFKNMRKFLYKFSFCNIVRRTIYQHQKHIHQSFSRCFTSLAHRNKIELVRMMGLGGS